MNSGSDCLSSIVFVLFAIGFVKIVHLMAKLLRDSFNFLKPCKNLRIRYGDGSWAVVTGASDGIGKAFCFDLAEKGFNICLIARNKEKLNQVVKEIEQNQEEKKKTMVQTKLIVFDFLNSAEPDALENLFKQLHLENPSILINNVGVHEFDEFHVQDEKAIRDTLLINCYSIILLTRYIIPFMLQRSNKYHSTVVNLCSIAGRRPMPYFAAYSATRIFSDFFSQALAMEYSDKKIDVIALRPGIVDTSHSKQRKSEGVFQISARECSRAALKRMGNENTTSGHWIHKLYVNVALLLPDFFIKRNAKKRVQYKRLLGKHE